MMDEPQWGKSIFLRQNSHTWLLKASNKIQSAVYLLGKYFPVLSKKSFLFVLWLPNDKV